MDELIGKINALNQGGYIYLQTKLGDIFLYDSKTKLELPDAGSMDYVTRDQYSINLELIYDREIYEKTNTEGVFKKTLRLKDITGIQAYKRVKI